MIALNIFSNSPDRSRPSITRGHRAETLIHEVLGLLHGRLHGGKIRVRVEKIWDLWRSSACLNLKPDRNAANLWALGPPVITIGRKAAPKGAYRYSRATMVGIDHGSGPHLCVRQAGSSDRQHGIGLALAKHHRAAWGGSGWNREAGSSACLHFTLRQAETRRTETPNDFSTLKDKFQSQMLVFWI
jgi:hypothetical protein